VKNNEKEGGLASGEMKEERIGKGGRRPVEREPQTSEEPQCGVMMGGRGKLGKE